MTLEVFIVLLLVAALLFAIVRKLFFIAVLIAVVTFAYYTGLAGAFFDILMNLWPNISDGTDIAQTITNYMTFA